MKYIKWIVTAVLTFLSIREMEHIFNKLLNEDSYLKINELAFDKLLSPSITFCPTPGGFHLADLIITELKSHMTSHLLKLQHSYWRANLVKDFFTNKFSTNKRTPIYNRSCDL